MQLSDRTFAYGLSYLDVVEICMDSFSWPLMLLY